jgi:GDP-D-mannose 3',5'-epimerase
MGRSAVVCGAGGFIAGHLVKRLKAEGYWVRGVDIKRPEFSASAADEFQVLDLRKPENCADALTIQDRRPDEVYQLAADMGGMGFIHNAECEILRNNALINIHMVDAAARVGRSSLFFLVFGLHLPRHDAGRTRND